MFGMSTILIPVALAVVWGIAMIRLSVWRTGRMLEENSRPLDDPGLQAQAQRLAHALDMPRIEVRVFEVDAVNGLAAPDGRIYLTRGFVQKYRRGEVSAEELAAVIAHELGHVAMGHLRRRMIDLTGQNAIFVVLTALLSRVLPFVGIWIANAIATALAARLSRRDEFEADAYATALLIKAGIGTGPQKSLFAKLDALTGGAGAAIPDWLRSHPAGSERIAAIEANEARWMGA